MKKLTQQSKDLFNIATMVYGVRCADRILEQQENGDFMKLQWLADNWDIVIKVNNVVLYIGLIGHHESIGRC